MEKAGMTITKRLWILTTVLVLNLAFVGMYEAWNSENLTKHLNNISHTQLPAVRNMTLVDMMHDGLRAVVLNGIVVVDLEEQNFDEVQKEYDQFSSDITKYLNDLEALDLNPATRSAIEPSRPQIAAYLKSGQEVINAAKKRDLTTARALLPAYAEAFERLEHDLEKLGELIAKDAENSDLVATKMAESARTWGTAMIIFGILFGIGSAAWIIRDLVAKMRGITGSVSDEAAHLSTASNQIKTTSQMLAESTTEHSAAIEESVASMEEIMSMIGQTVQNAELAMRESESGQQEARKGGEVVATMVQSMTQIHAANVRLEKIVKLIGDIKEKTKIINDIAFETKLLSFNASIEAARAGVHGKGFAVVAEEVGKLANVSNKAADEVRVLLDNSISEVGQIVGDTREKVNAGQSTSRECERVFGEMKNALGRITSSVQMIASAAKEQETGVRQTNEAMMEMDRVTQRDSKSAEELALESAGLSQAAGSLNAAAGRMRALVFGSHEMHEESPSQGRRRDTLKSQNRKGNPEVSNLETLSQPQVGLDSSFESKVAKVNPKGSMKIKRSDPRWKAAS